jgi:hypothetical protein
MAEREGVVQSGKENRAEITDWQPTPAEAATYAAPIVSSIFVCSPLFAGLASTMTLEMSLTPNVFRDPSVPPRQNGDLFCERRVGKK